MADLDREVRVAAGRRAGDGQLRLSVFAGDLLAVALEGRGGERAPTLLLTREQAARLHDAIGELLPLLGESKAGDERAGAWQGVERRRASRPR